MINIVNYNVIIYIMNINIKHQQHHPQQQRYSNDNVFTKREHILITHIRAPTVPKVNHVLHRKHSYHRHLQHIYLTESNAMLSSSKSFRSKKGSIRVLPQCKSEINVINNAKHVHRNNNNNNQHEPLRNCINKIREITLIRNSTETKKQRVVCLKQTYDNEINGLNDMISSLNASNVLFTETFAVKFNEHVKQLRYQTENEKRKLHSLIHTVMTCKHSIKQLEAQIKKIEADKTNVLKWLYLQIKVKERQLTLPSHYATILEHNNINNSVNAVVNVSSSNRNCIRNNTRKLHTIQQLIPLNEIERICNYKEHLIYQTADAFIKQLHHIENDNITKLETYNALLNELQLLRNERNELCMQIKLRYTNTQHEVDAKVKEVTKLKLKHAKLLQCMDELCVVSTNNSKCLLDMKWMLKRSKLFKKVVELYNTTLSVRSNTMMHCAAAKKGNEMLMMLKYVEIAVDGLFAVVNYYNSNKEVYYGRLKQIKNKIEMKHKIEHALHQKEVDKEKWLGLQERIQERNNKVYYKQYRKGNDYYKWLMKNTKKKMISEEHVPQPSFQEFMYDVIDDNN